jgi:tetratricopeptide (TPR) repeat protein
MQSQWIYEYLTATYGTPKILAFLNCFHDGLTEAQAWQKTYGKSMDDMDREFLAWAGKQIDAWGLSTDPIPKRDAVEAALKTNPDDVTARFQLALLQAGSGKNKDAQTNLEKVLALDPNHIKARELLGGILHAQKQNAKAKELLTAVVQDDPKLPVALRTLGLIAMDEKNYDDAEKWFTQLQAVRPLEQTSYSSLAGIYLSRQQNDKAIAQLLELERHEQKDERIPRKLADLYVEQKQWPQAQDAAFRAIRINPFNAVNHALMAQILVAQKDPDQSIPYWQNATALQPQIPAYRQGLTAAQKAVDLNPNSPAAK